MSVREPEIRQFYINCLRNCLLGDHQTKRIITLGGVRENIGKKIKAGANFSPQPQGARYLTGSPNHDCSVPSWSGDHQRGIEQKENGGWPTDSDQTESSLTTPKCACCHRKDKKLPTLPFVLFADSFISQILFLCYFLLNEISYFRACG